MKIKVYTTKTCPECMVVKSFLTAMGADFESILVDTDEKINYIVDKTGQRRVPVLECGDDCVVGFKKDAIKNMVAKAKTA